MATYYDGITDEQRQLIETVPLFFIASADPDLAPNAQGGGPVNVSPKGGVPLVILDRNHVAFLDYAGSGNETARHARAGGPVTVMVCSFDENAAIIRLYGHARMSAWEDSPLAARFMGERSPDLKLTARQIVEIDVERTMTSCGFGVPLMQTIRERQHADRGKRYKD